jgi:phosphatidylserine/phosphatidylglycerophosphate/cardiolipin synthase-like enzyme
MWPSEARATEFLCDPSVSAQTQNGVSVYPNCRQPLLDLIDHENVGIDVAFWFMEDQRYMNHIITRWKAGVPVRLIVDPRANSGYPLNADTLQKFRDAGIPMIKKKAVGGIMHWKMMLFAGQNTVEFGSANYSQYGFVSTENYTNYVAETIYFCDDPAIVNSFKWKFDNLWTNTTNYVIDSNLPSDSSRTRVYAFAANDLSALSADMNFPPASQGFAGRLVGLEKTETQKIDVIMYRISQQAHSDALIAAHNRGVPVRYLGETSEYRDTKHLDRSVFVAWNMDRMYAAGIPMRVRASLGLNHEKVVLLYGQAMSVFGSSNMSAASDDSQEEHNYFTKKWWMFKWFMDEFERKWYNSTGNTETTAFVPLPPGIPATPSIASGATEVPTTGQKLGWYGGPWAWSYDIYFGTNPNATTLLAGNQPLGPSKTTAQKQSFALPTLQPGTTYYWKIVSKTAASLSRTGPIWSFRTTGTTPPPSAGTVVLSASSTPAAGIHGNWSLITDSTASGGKALQNTDHAASKIAPALASPANYFERSFSASSGVPYHLWLRMRAQNNSMGNDSVHVQFSDSLSGPGGAATMRIGTTSSAEVVLQNGSSGSAPHNWGWADNGWGVPGVQIYFASTGTHTLRIQQREDGAIVDQIVLSPDTYLNGPPGARLDDSTILP